MSRPDLIQQVINVEVSTLKREGKDFSFEDVFPLIVRVKQIVSDPRVSPEFWEFFPHSKQTSALEECEMFLRTLQDLRGFTPSTQNPQGVRDELALRLRSSYERIYEKLLLPLQVDIALREVTSGRLKDELEQIRKDPSDLNMQAKVLVEQAQASVDQLTKKREEADEILGAMMNASAQTGVSRFQTVFGSQANIHRNFSVFWAAVCAIAGIAITMFLLYALKGLTDAIRDTSVDFKITIQLFLAKILLLSFFSVVFYQLVKNYNANMHLYTINKHRQNSLKAFEAFVASTEDRATKDTVLIQATKAIFEAGDSGYVSSKESSFSGIETIKLVEQQLKKD